MAAAVVQAKVGDTVTYHGSVIVAHGGGEIVRVHANGRVDIRVNEPVYALEQRGNRWVEVSYRMVHNVRPESWKPRAGGDAS